MRITWPILLLPLIQALITLESIRELTRLTDDLRVKIEESVEGSGVAVEENELLGVGGSVGQRVLGLEVEGRKGDEDGDEDGDEVEDVSSSFFLFCLILSRRNLEWGEGGL